MTCFQSRRAYALHNLWCGDGCTEDEFKVQKYTHIFFQSWQGVRQIKNRFRYAVYIVFAHFIFMRLWLQKNVVNIIKLHDVA